MAPRIDENVRLQMIASNPLTVVNIIINNFHEKRDYYYGNFSNAIYDYLTLEEATLLLRTLSECTCCQRHQVNRPSRLGDFHRGQSNHHHQEHNEPCCQCPCRHFSRWICRTFQDIENSDLP